MIFHQILINSDTFHLCLLSLIRKVFTIKIIACLKAIAMIEKQKMTSWWIWGLLILINIGMLAALIIQLVFHIPVGNNPAPDYVLILSFVVTASVFLLLAMLYLKITLISDILEIQFYPFLKKTISLKEVKNIEVVKYSPLTDYGGWGIRFSSKEMAYTVDGNDGLSITLLNGKHLLVGIKKDSKFKTMDLKKLLEE